MKAKQMLKNQSMW